MKKKILFVIESLNCGGAEKALVSLLDLIDYDKYDIDLLLTQRGGIFEELLNENVNILDTIKFSKSVNKSIIKNILDFNILLSFNRLKYFFMLKGNKMNLHKAQLFWKVFNKQIDSLNTEYDIAIAYNQGFSTYYVAEKVNANRKIAWLNIDFEKAGYKKDLDEKFYNKFDVINVVSEEGAELFKKCYPKLSNNIKYSEDIINPNMIYNMANSEESFTDNYKGTRILTVGRLAYQKGYDIATKACKILKEENIDFRWYVLGDGEEKNNIEKDIQKYDISDRFFLLGLKKNPYSYMKDCDIYVQTSKFEGKPLTIREAHLFNKPVVSTNFSTAKSLLHDKSNCILTELNPQSVADGILEIINNTELKTQIINNITRQKKGNSELIEKFYYDIEES